MLRALLDRIVRRSVINVMRSEWVYARLEALEDHQRARKSATHLAPMDLQARALDLLRCLEPEDVGGNFVRMGGAGDGGYVMLQEGLKGRVAYSLGINDDVAWDRDMAARGYDVFMYDHTITGLPESNPRFHYARLGVRGSGLGEDTRTIEWFLGENGHADERDIILKIDVEDAEWSVFAEMGDDVLRRFVQIVVELHGLHRFDDDERYPVMLKALRKLSRHFAPVHVHANNHGQCVMNAGVPVPEFLEVTFVRRSDFALSPGTRSFPTELDSPNHPRRPEIILGAFRFPAVRNPTTPQT
ncbi:MAG: FkbM family methyltransferase [Rhizobiaceae bacterium]